MKNILGHGYILWLIIFFYMGIQCVWVLSKTYTSLVMSGFKKARLSWPKYTKQS